LFVFNGLTSFSFRDLSCTEQARHLQTTTRFALDKLNTLAPFAVSCPIPSYRDTAHWAARRVVIKILALARSVTIAGISQKEK
jgi:hypothetical protein